MEFSSLDADGVLAVYFTRSSLLCTSYKLVIIRDAGLIIVIIIFGRTASRGCHSLPTGSMGCQASQCVMQAAADPLNSPGVTDGCTPRGSPSLQVLAGILL